MAKDIPGKGTVIKHNLGAGLVAIANVISIDIDEAEVETYDMTTLDTSDAGKEYGRTGYVESNSVSYEIFLDPALAGHQGITDFITTPDNLPMDITFADTGSTNWTWNAASCALGVTVAMNDGLKASCSHKIDGLIVYAT